MKRVMKKRFVPNYYDRRVYQGGGCDMQDDSFKRWSSMEGKSMARTRMSSTQEVPKIEYQGIWRYHDKETWDM